jgi:hypothetical protein
MKRFIVCLFSLCFAFIYFSSCCKENTGVDDKRSQLVGEWLVNQHREEFTGDFLTSSIDSQFDLTLHEDGTGFQTSPIGNDPLTWVHQPNPETVAIINDVQGSFPGFSTTTVFEVILNMQQSQEWKSDKTYEDNAGLSKRTIIQWNSTRK